MVGKWPEPQHADRCHSNTSTILWKLLGSEVPIELGRLEKSAKHRVLAVLAASVSIQVQSIRNRIWSCTAKVFSMGTLEHFLFVGLAIARKKQNKRDMTSTVMQRRDAQRQQGQSTFDLWSPCFGVFLEQVVSFRATSFLCIYGHLAIRIKLNMNFILVPPWTGITFQNNLFQCIQSKLGRSMPYACGSQNWTRWAFIGM